MSAKDLALLNDASLMLTEDQQRQVRFLREVVALSRKYGVSLSHEDGHGGFEVETLSEYNLEWLAEAALKPGGTGSWHCEFLSVIRRDQDDYLAAGQPYGESVADFRRWVEERNWKRERGL